LTLFIGPEAARLRVELDAVLFDMDGVLIDITRSIRRVNCLAPAFYLREVVGWASSDDIVCSDTIELYKHAGGFNDDWDLTYAIVLAYLVAAAETGVRDADRLLSARDHAAIAESIEARGGGLDAAESILLGGCAGRRAEVERDYDKTVIRAVFEEILSGDLCGRMYGRPAVMYRGRGLIHEDRCLLDRSKLPTGKKIGMQTGRTYEEAVIGREFCSLEDVLPDDVCVTKRDGFHKPEPGGLARLARNLGIEKAALYIGDTLDDLRTVRNLNALEEYPPFLIALVLTGPAGDANETVFRDAGADIVGKDVNEVLDWVNDSSIEPR
jgi:HAD superfamily hydrolase (TIGR01548 family)